MSRLTRDGTAEPVSRDQIFGHERGQKYIHFPCSADRVQDWQPCPIDPYSCYVCDHTYSRTDSIPCVQHLKQRTTQTFSCAICSRAVVCVCVCAFSSHPFWTSSSLDVPAGVTQEEGHAGFFIHLLSAVRAIIFLEKDSGIPFPRRP